MGVVGNPSRGAGGKRRVRGREGAAGGLGPPPAPGRGERAAPLDALCSRFPLYYVTEPSAALKIQHYKLIVMLPH